MRRHRYYIVLLMILIVPQLDGQSTAREPVEYEEYEQILQDIDLDQSKKALIPRQRKENKPRESFDLPKTSSPVLSIFKILSILLFVVILGILIYFIIANSNMRDKKIEDGLMDEHIDDIDTVHEYNQAMGESNYRLAIRMRFIKVLQILQDKRWINWKSEKTNRDYSNELRDKEPFESFRKLANYYENIWYGNTGISREEFFKIEPEFIQFVKRYE